MQKRYNRSNRHSSCGGFTLIEVLLVVAILGILAAVVVVNVAGRSEKAAIQATRASIAGVSMACKMFEIDTGRYPGTLSSLLTTDGSPNWSGPYLDGDKAPVDAWGAELGYSKTGSGFKITSAGPDGSMGGGDDLTN